jgi:hypothetical protein
MTAPKLGLATPTIKADRQFSLMQKSPHLKGNQQKHWQVVIRRDGALSAIREQLTDRRGNSEGRPTGTLEVGSAKRVPSPVMASPKRRS